jgi:uncharacterized protein (DUF697 family)/GTP-binding protein EngB required for normal cell division
MQEEFNTYGLNSNSIESVTQQALSKIRERVANLNELNIIVTGKTGVGKSTLINSVFRNKPAKTGMGKPVTKHMQKYTERGVPLNIYDTRGFELGKEVQDEVKAEINEKISKGFKSCNINKHIHCIWYCINTASNRVEPEEISFIRELSKKSWNAETSEDEFKVPIIIVLTQSFSAKKAQEIYEVLFAENLNVESIVPVLAEDYEIDGLGTAKAYGLDILVKVMERVLPEELLDTLQNVQIADLDGKKRKAHAAVATAASAAAFTGAVPIPFSDSAILIPEQVAMIGTITAIFGLDVDKNILSKLITATIGAGGTTVLGKTVVSNLLKLIPGAGSVAGGAISAGTAAVITAALGEAYIGVMELVFNGNMNINDLKTSKGMSIMSDLFKQNLKTQSKDVFKKTKGIFKK